MQNETRPDWFELDEFTQAYITAALWSSNDNSDESGGEPLDANYGPDDIADATFIEMVNDCKDFQEANAEDIEAASNPATESVCGYDFWLTRCGHGAGFWDRGLGEIGKRLTKAAKVYGNVELVVSDGKIYA